MDTQRGEQRVALDVAGGVASYDLPRVARNGRGPLVAACSRAGRGRRVNEDAVAVLPEEGLFIVADGMGGHHGAARAARLTVEELPIVLRAALRRVPSRDGDRLTEVLAERVAAFSERLRAIDPEMGTTVVVAVVRGRRVFVAHAGDSRAYRFRRGELRALTRDHSFVQALVDAGRLDTLSARLHPARGALLRYLGMPRPSIAVRSLRVLPGDRLLLSTDGLHEVLPPTRLERVLREARDPKSAACSLVELVEMRGGRDDTTALVLDWP